MPEHRTTAWLIGLFLVTSTVALAEPVQVRNAWIPEAPPNARMLAGYLDLENAGSTPVVIVAARAEGFGRVEIHRTVTEDGVSRMRRQDRLVVDPGQTVTFEPGGLHLMFMHMDRRPRPGDRVEVELIDAEGVSWTFSAEMRPRHPE